MAQVLKDEIRDRIFEAALAEFYEKDFKTATMRDITVRAGIPTGLIYHYYKNKQALFDEIVRPVIGRLPEILKQAERADGSPFENYVNIEKNFFLSLFDKRREFILLMDKSAGTLHHDAKENMIALIEQHIKISFQKRSKQQYDDLLPHILATNFVESILEIIRHFKSREWAEMMMDLVTKQFFEGSNSL